MRTRCRGWTQRVVDATRYDAHLAHRVWVYDRPWRAVSDGISGPCLLADDDVVDHEPDAA